MADQYEKFPSYHHYPADWIVGTATLTLEQKGAFQDLLDYSWEQVPPCTLPGDDASLAALVRVSIQKWRKMKGPIVAKFEKLPDGRIRNPKLYKIYLEAVEHRQRRRNAGNKGNEARWGSQSDSQCDPNAVAEGVANDIAKPSPPSPSPFLTNKTDGVHAPQTNSKPERVGAIVARIAPAVNS